MTSSLVLLYINAFVFILLHITVMMYRNQDVKVFSSYTPGSGVTAFGKNFPCFPFLQPDGNNGKFSLLSQCSGAFLASCVFFLVSNAERPMPWEDPMACMLSCCSQRSQLAGAPSTGQGRGSAPVCLLVEFSTGTRDVEAPGLCSESFIMKEPGLVDCF
jgi:hypothetical protein